MAMIPVDSGPAEVPGRPGSDGQPTGSPGGAAARGGPTAGSEAVDWVALQTALFVGPRKDLQGPTAWKWVVPRVPQRGKPPDEIFSAIRGSGCLQEDARGATEAKLRDLRHCAELVRRGWCEFQGSVQVLPSRPSCQVEPRREFDFNAADALAGPDGSCRRVGYRVTEDRQGIEVRLEVCLRAAFALILQCLRYPAVDLAAEWQLTDGQPLDVGVDKTAAANSPFQLLDNSADEMHPQPPNFTHALRPEQRRSLQWMIYRESTTAPLVLEFCRYWQRWMGTHETQAALDRSVAPEWCLDCRIFGSFLVRGGVLADKIGYGKTALVIGLLDTRQDEVAPSLPAEDKDCFFSSKATLICVPSNLHQQWIDEIVKFTGARYRIVSLRAGVDMARVRVQELTAADVVVCNYQLLWGAAYDKRKEELVTGACRDEPCTYEQLFGKSAKKVDLEDLRRATRRFIQDSARHAWADFLDSDRGMTDSSPAWVRLRFPVLEQFFWHRVVFDEFHELEASEFVRRAPLQYLRSCYRWGLTGTPSLGSAQHVAAMASLLRVDVAGPVPDLKTANGSASIFGSWAGDTDITTVENCRRFLDACVRQNTAQLPKIETSEHLILIKQTPSERALYLAESCGVEGADSLSPDSERNQRLLILCSHFSAEQLRSASAGEECGRVLRIRQQAVANAEGALRASAAALECFKSLLGPEHNGTAAAVEEQVQKLSASPEEHLKEVSQLIDAARRAFHGQELAAFARDLHGSESWKKLIKRAAIRPGEKATDAPEQPAPPARAPSKAELRRGFEACGSAVVCSLEDLLTATSQLTFLQKTLSLVSDGSDKSARTCSICFEEDLQLRQLGITPCAHVFCLPCLGQLIAKTRRCGICRHELDDGDARPLMLEIPGLQDDELAEDEAAEQCDERFRKYGTKLGSITRTLQRIKADDAAAKCIVFCQWDCLLQKISSAFREFGIRHRQLRGSIYNRTRAMAEFKQETSGIDVLLLSLEQSASGSNLTCANHVLLVHPMSAATQEQAVAFELQAIGRVRRWGQRRREVHVWRFCTVGTLEEDITRRHQQEIWERGPIPCPRDAPARSGRAPPGQQPRAERPPAGTKRQRACAEVGRRTRRAQGPPAPAPPGGAGPEDQQHPPRGGPGTAAEQCPPDVPRGLPDGSTSSTRDASPDRALPAALPQTARAVPLEAAAGGPHRRAWSHTWRLLKSPSGPIEL